MKKHNPVRKHILKRVWIAFGAILLAWTMFWFIYVRILNHYAFITNVILLVVGYCLLINYALITAVYWAVKRLKKEWEIRE